MSTEEWLAWVEQQEAEQQARPPPADGRTPISAPHYPLRPPPRAKSAPPGSPVHEYVKGGRVPFWLRRTWEQPKPGARPVCSGIEIDPAGAQLVREIFQRVRSGQTLIEISQALGRQFGRDFSITNLHSILHHPLHRNPPGRAAHRQG